MARVDGGEQTRRAFRTPATKSDAARQEGVAGYLDYAFDVSTSFAVVILPFRFAAYSASALRGGVARISNVGSLVFPLAGAVRPPPTTSTSNLRARAGSVSLTAVDVEDMAGDE